MVVIFRTGGICVAFPGFGIGRFNFPKSFAEETGFAGGANEFAASVVTLTTFTQ